MSPNSESANWYLLRPGQKKSGPFVISELSSLQPVPGLQIRRRPDKWVAWSEAHLRYPELVAAGIVKSPGPTSTPSSPGVTQDPKEFPHSAETDGRLQVTAAVSLLESSRLVDWRPQYGEFSAVEPEVFEFYWQKAVDPVFGRLICWIKFSAGAELLAKGVCLLRGIEIREKIDVVKPPGHYSEGYKEWASKIRSNWQSSTAEATGFGTLGGLLNKKSNGPSVLEQLCDACHASEDQKNLVIASYQLLRTTIRNRDAHSYIPNVRSADFRHVEYLFVPCFNDLVRWLPEGSQQLNDFKANAKAFIASI